MNDDTRAAAPQDQTRYVLETDRLRLRVPKLSDLPFEQEMCLEERYKFMWQYKEPERCVWTFITCLEIWTEHGFGALAIEDKETQAYLGMIYLDTRPVEPDNQTAWFMGFGLTSAAEGKGIAYEASVAAKAWYLGECGLSLLYVDPDPANERSKTLAKRLDGVFEGYTEHFYYGQLELWRMSAS